MRITECINEPNERLMAYPLTYQNNPRLELGLWRETSQRVYEWLLMHQSQSNDSYAAQGVIVSSICYCLNVLAADGDWPAAVRYVASRTGTTVSVDCHQFRRACHQHENCCHWLANWSSESQIIFVMIWRWNDICQRVGYRIFRKQEVTHKVKLAVIIYGGRGLWHVAVIKQWQQWP